MNKLLTFSTLALTCGLIVFLGVGCSSNGVVQETTYQDGFETNSAVLQETANGGYRTISGNPVVVVNDDVEPESLLPYGGGDEGIRQAEDESPYYINDASSY